MKERRWLSRELKRAGSILLLLCFILAGSFFFTKDVDAATFSDTQKEYINVLSKFMIEGTVSGNLDVYRTVSQGKSGKKCMEAAAISNRAALMAEGIDFLDSNWSQYYAVETRDGATTFNSTKLISRSKFRRRYKKIIRGLDEALSTVDSSMSQADKAMAVYIYFAENTTYKESKDAHTGYDVLVSHVGVCDGLANAYALAMNTLGIPCAVISNYSKNHSWNIVKLNGIWYFVDLTNGVGVGKHEGMVVTYDSFLVGKNTFLKTHPGYKKQDLYGQGNSNNLKMRKIKLASSDYIKNSKEMKQALENKTCTFYHKGYWYWISQDNYLKKSNLRGNKAVVFYAPRSGNYIGWIRQYNNRIILSLNSGIYRMSFLNKYPILLKKVDNRDKNAETKGALWSLIYIGRFIVNKNGWLSYYTTDFHGVRRGNVKIFLGRAQQSGQLTKSGRKIIQLQAGQIKQLATIHMHDRGLRTAGWTSANPSIVSIDNNGYMKAKRSGKTYISTRINGRKRTFRVKVSGYTITYKNVGINSSKNREMLSGKRAVTLRSPRKKGYTFVGWYDSSGKNVTVIPKGNTKNLILHAKWDKTSSKDSVKAK
ncbi:transglutaminase domain-containing protein [Anaerobutyricum hallii]|uniref:transglutaminase domain-containing protein n=1 Tax=Anaerobutyricum hallii TaxID=39488 RepID=UPI003A8522F4